MNHVSFPLELDVRSFRLTKTLQSREVRGISHLTMTCLQTTCAMQKQIVVLLPTDPAEWNAWHIKSWLKWSARQFSLNPEPDPEKFPSSGAELLELSRAEFESKAESRRSGRLLTVHLAHLRHSVTGRSTSPMDEHIDLDDEEEQGKKSMWCQKSTKLLVPSHSGPAVPRNCI